MKSSGPKAGIYYTDIAELLFGMTGISPGGETRMDKVEAGGRSGRSKKEEFCLTVASSVDRGFYIVRWYDIPDITAAPLEL